MAFFSVIIPVYNVEKYLRECVDSVINQTFRDIEVILVDDGSPDKCPEICDAYAAVDSRISVIHKENGGLSSARNAGIRASVGEYILFLDSDDYWCDNNALSKLFNILEENHYDALIYHAFLLYPDKGLVKDRADRDFSLQFNSLNFYAQAQEMIYKDLMPGSAWIFAVKRIFLVRANLFFQEGIRSEDTEWMFRLLKEKPKFGETKERFYVYRKGRQGSVTNTIDACHLRQYVNMLSECMDSEFEDDDVKEIVLSYAAYHLTIAMGLTARLKNKRDRESLFCRIKDIDKLLRYHSHPKVKKVLFIKCLLGTVNTSKILGMYLKNRKG